MKVLVIANHARPEMNLLTEGSSTAMLPVASKSILEHTLESIARLSNEQVDKTDITLVASRGLDQIREFIGSGEKWGMKINILSSRPNANAQMLQCTPELLGADDLLIVECDRLRSATLQDYLQAANASFGHALEEHSTAATSGLTLVCKTANSHAQKCLHLDSSGIYPITTPAEFHHTNMQAAAGEIQSITTRGRERALGLTTGFLTRVHPKSIKLGKALVGNHCRIHTSCALQGQVVVNNGVVVDRNTTIENSVILDRTFVGENLEIKNAILTGNLLIRVDTGAVIEITDRFLTAKLGESLYDTHFATAVHQLAGIMLLLTSLPLWPIALLAAFIKSPYQLWTQHLYVGNKSRDKGNHGRVFKTLEFQASHPLLRHLPLTLALARGHIRLVGVSLCTPEELGDRTDSWQILRDSAPCGALGPTQLYVPAEASSDEKIMSDAIFAQQSSASASLHVLAQSIKKLLGLQKNNRGGVFSEGQFN